MKMMNGRNPDAGDGSLRTEKGTPRNTWNRKQEPMLNVGTQGEKKTNIEDSTPPPPRPHDKPDGEIYWDLKRWCVVRVGAWGGGAWCVWAMRAWQAHEIYWDLKRAYSASEAASS
jgi:hypothetical protein